MDGWMVRTALKTKSRLVIAWMFVMFCLAACGGGGGGSSGSSLIPQPPAGGTPPPGNSPPPAPAPTVPQFTRAFAQFIGTPSATAAGDLDGDGRDDLVVVTTDFFDSGPGSDRLYVYYQENGVLGAPKFVDTAGTFGNNTWSVALCDVNGDGKKEILVGYSAGDLAVYTLAADGTPYLSTTLSGVRSTKIICVDIDGDGLSDVVTVGKVGVNMQVLLQRNGTLTELDTYPQDAFWGLLVEAGDINGDGKTDIVMFGFARVPPYKRLYAYIQDGPGHFTPPIELHFPFDINSGYSVNGFAIADLASRGNRDIVASFGGSRPWSNILVSSYASSGSIGSTSSLSTIDNPQTIVVGDINADGHNDIVVLHNGWGSIGVHYQNADGTFAEEQLLYTWLADQALTGQAIAIGDFNSDGKRDIAVADQTALFVFLQQ